MLKKILGTIGTRYLIAFLNLMLIFINAKALGVEGVGLVGILLASINIAVVFNGVLSGNTIVSSQVTGTLSMNDLPGHDSISSMSAAKINIGEVNI